MAIIFGEWCHRMCTDWADWRLNGQEDTIIINSCWATAEWNFTNKNVFGKTHKTAERCKKQDPLYEPVQINNITKT